MTLALFLVNKDVDELYNIANLELIALSNWLKANKLSLNISKTNFMIFTKCNNFQRLCALRDVKIDNVSIARVEKCKFLGVIIEEKVCWKSHIMSIMSTVARNLGVIKRIRSKIMLLLHCYYMIQ